MTPIEQLDIVLFFIYNRESDQAFTFEELWDDYEIGKIKGTLTVGLLNEMLQKLLEDKHLSEISPMKYYTSFNGRIFALKGGYVGDILSSIANQKRIFRNERYLFLATLLSGLGAMGLIFFEYVKLNNPVPIFSVLTACLLVLFGAIAGAILYKIMSSKEL